MRKIYQYILIAVVLVAMALYSNELDEALYPVNNGSLQFVVSDFPAGAAPRAVGLENEGKTAWENNDKILVHLYSQEYGNQAVELTFNNGDWESDGGTLSYLKDEKPTITAVYAPDCEIKSDKTIGLIDGKQYGTAEYIQAETTISGKTLGIRFESGRTYSRLRLTTMPKAALTVKFTGFTPAGPNGTTAPESYSLIADDDGNAYLYGTFAINGTVTATAKHEIYPEEGITTTSRTSAFKNRPSTSGQSYVLGVKLGDKVDAQLALSGDVALKDGSFVSNAKISSMTEAQKKAAVGIVFMTTVETNTYDRTYPAKLTDDKVMNADFPQCTHGLIVSLKNLEAMSWQANEESVFDVFQSQYDEFNPSTSDYVSIRQSNNTGDMFYKILGYQSTKVLQAYNAYCEANGKSGYIMNPVAKLDEFATSNPAPFGSTGWYLPSAKELSILCNGDVDEIWNVAGSKNNMQTINSLLEALNADPLGSYNYWGSMETGGIQGIAFNFSNGSVNYPRKINSDCYVRFICAF